MINKGPLLVLASQFFAVTIHGLAKYLETTASVDPQQILQVRMFITLSINSLFLTTRYPNELPLGKKSVRHLLILRSLGGICGSAGFYCEYPVHSLKYLPLADATTLNLLAPLGASLVTTKKFTLIEIGSIAICFLGVGLITKPSFVIDLLYYNDADNHQKIWTSQSRLGLACSMIGVLGGVCAYSSISKIGLRSHPLVTTNCFATSILIVSSACFAAVPGVNFNFDLGLLQWFIMGSIGLSGALMEYLLTAGLSDEGNSYAVHMIYFQVVLALVADWLIWHTIPDITSGIGAGLIIQAMYVIQKYRYKEDDIVDIEMAPYTRNCRSMT
ncbi:putative uncharacterized membrane protein [Botrytis fragariae]|uniref:Uncharacterized membrane protein n=1 Tax=Botrytis fragariae TaxID=1964551 RepID=A0A8H6EDK7_9HELO|nr:putative uncharacterized membrane protein [Botrytis fragariae]KAF5868412.1 putative uncharacterized membrane protein [Botrytis fragariae]